MSNKKHTIVNIYHDVITKTQLEGKACLLHKVKDLSDDLELWKVCFEGEDGTVYERTINLNNRKSH